MPVATREAMLRGLEANERVIVGAYVDDLGGVCPMLAAHRSGGRTDFLSFAKSWDRFTGAKGRVRPATEREVGILVGQLQASLGQERGLELDQAIREHWELVARGRRVSRGRRGRGLLDEGDPRGEIRARRLLRPRGIFGGDNSAQKTAGGSLSPVPARA
jgi:hypothetical protein